MELMRLSEMLPASGVITQLQVCPQTLTAARECRTADDMVTSVQADHLTTRMSGRAQQEEMWLGVTWSLPGEHTPQQVATALTAMARKHEVLRTWFDPADHGFVRRTLAPEALTFVPGACVASDSLPTDAAAIVRNSCSPFAPFGYTMLYVESGSETRLVFAMDHSYGDAQSLLIACEEIHRQVTGAAPVELPAQGYSHFAARELEARQAMTLDHDAVQAWLTFFRRGEPSANLGTFPGWATRSQTPSPVEPHRFTFFTEEQAPKLEEEAAARGVNVISLIYGALALAARDVAGTENFRFVNPVQQRAAQEAFSLGWYTRLVPMHIATTADDDLASVASRVRREFSQNRFCADYPFLDAYRVLGETLSQSVSSWDGRFMLSYMDTRLFGYGLATPPPGFALVSEAGEDVNISAWIFRGSQVTEALVVAPRHPDAAAAVDALFTRACRHVNALL